MNCQACGAPLVRVWKSWTGGGGNWSHVRVTRRAVFLRCAGCLWESAYEPWGQVWTPLGERIK